LRLWADLDPTFAGGKVTTAFNFGPGITSAFAVAQQPDGRIVLAGVTERFIINIFFVLRKNLTQPSSMPTSYLRPGFEEVEAKIAAAGGKY
jgi:hypothetical protein